MTIPAMRTGKTERNPNVIIPINNNITVTLKNVTATTEAPHILVF